MRRAALLGNPDTKRTQYLQQAAKEVGLPLAFVDWKEWRDGLSKLLRQDAPDGILLKIDPPLWESCILGELDGLAGSYQLQLQEIGQMAEPYGVEFFNHPAAITALLDKGACKETLAHAGLPVTELLAKNLPDRTPKFAQDHAAACPTIHNAAQLLELMQCSNISQVFIKPVHGSGAAGVSAFRWQRRGGKMALYTCAMEHPQMGLANTKRLRRFSDTDTVVRLLDQLLGMGCILERWHAKAQYQGYSYDLRAVVQDGRLDYLLARLSKGPITNLQLNNRPLDIDALELPASVVDAVTDLCLRALALYPGLTSAGIDILLEQGSLRPRIIEMNGQGDLIYQDIYRQNTIYRHQAEILKQQKRETKKNV